MKVKELIIALQEVDEECEVFGCPDEWSGYYLKHGMAVTESEFVKIDGDYEYLDIVKRDLEYLEGEVDDLSIVSDEYWQERLKVLKEAIKQTPIKGIVL